MATLLALAGLIDRNACFGGLSRWAAIHGGAVAIIFPWLRGYLDHAPEFLSGTLSVRYLVGTPISFVGGNFLLLIGLFLLIARGIGGAVSFAICGGDGKLSLKR